MQSLPPAVRLKFSKAMGLNRFQNPIGFEPAPEKSGETPVFFFQIRDRGFKIRHFETPPVDSLFSHKRPARKGRVGVFGLSRKPFAIEAVPNLTGFWKKLN
jgi:hypothetical protein